MKTSEKQVKDIHAVMVTTRKGSSPVPGISMIANASIYPTELVFTLKELKAMVKECEKI